MSERSGETPTGPSAGGAWFRSLRGRLYLLVIPLAAVPVLILGLGAGYRSAAVLERESLMLQRAIAERIERGVSDFIEARLDELHLVDRVEGLATLSNESVESVLSRMLGHRQVYHSLHYLVPGRAEDIHVSRAYASTEDRHTPGHRALMDAARDAAQEPLIGRMRYVDDLREPLLTVSLPIRNRRTGAAGGVLIAEVRLRRVWDLLSDLSMPDGAEAYLVDGSGEVLAHRLAATVLARERISLPDRDGARTVDGATSLLTVAQPLAATSEPAFVVVTRREQDALAHAVEARSVTLATAAAIILVAVSLALWFSHQLARPLRALAGAARRVTAGELDTVVPAGGPSEVRELGETLGHMTARLAGIIEQLERSEYLERERATITLESIGDAVITTDEAARVSYLNPTAEEMTGWTTDEARGEPIGSVFDIINEKTREPAPDPVRRCLAEGRVVGLANHTVLRRKGGREYAIQDSAAPIRAPDGAVLGVVVVFSDVTAARAMQRQISHQAAHDALTGLVNRREFEHRVLRVLETARAEGSEHVLCYLDLDQFKVINDTCGHAAGDELLRQLSMTFKKSVRRRDTLGRLGGDEFGVLMEHCAVDQALRVAEKLREEVEALRFAWSDYVFNIGVSIGVVPITSASQSVDSVLGAADTACYIAKDAGRNRIHLYREDDDAVTQRHGQMRWVSELNLALEEDRLELHAQRIVDLESRSNAVPHFELLVRLVDETSERIRPTVFLAAAERYNLATRIDRWVIERALRWLATRGDTEKPILCSVNLSGTSLGEEGFLEFVLECFQSTGVDGRHVCFEITETAAIGNLTHATRFIHTVRRLGCRFALDDFGSGLSSFGYLKSLQVDFLKIDGAFVRDLAEDPVDYAMVRSINEIGQLMGMRTVAEFVESEAVLRKLREIGVDAVQGYHVGVPEPLDRIV